MEDPLFKSIKLNGWRQFDDIDIEFDRRLTVLTGMNGTGKTTILSLLGSSMGWQAGFTNTPEQTEQGGLRYNPDIRVRPSSGQQIRQSGDTYNIGFIEYTTNQKARIDIRDNGGDAQQPQLAGETPRVHGAIMPSHTPTPSGHFVGQIPVSPPQRRELLRVFTESLGQARFALNLQAGRAPHHRLKETLITLAYVGPGNEFVSRNEEALNMLRQFQALLKEVLPKSLGFKELRIVGHEIVLESDSGNFSFDGMSGGLAALVNIVWEIFLAAGNSATDLTPFAVIWDEPENHLHPALQRVLVPTLLKVFPSAQFILGTHSPFIVTAEPVSTIYMLGYNAEHRVTSTRITDLNRAGTANDTLRDVLGLNETMPLWAGERLRVILDGFKGQELTDQSLQQLAQALESIGLDRYVPRAVADLVGGVERDQD